MVNTFYTTLAEIKDRIDTSQTADDVLIMDAIEEACRALDEATARKFYPFIDTRYYDYESKFELELNSDDLLSVATLNTAADDGSGSEITASQYWLKCGDSYNLTPYDRIIINTSTSAEFDFVYTKNHSQELTGVFGFHRDYANAHKASGDTVQNDTQITASGTTLVVTDGANFEAGQTLLIESEWLHVASISDTDLTVERGINGSTAAAHANGTAISIFQPDPEVARVARRYALWLYKALEAPFTGEVNIDADGKAVIPQDAPPAVHRFVSRFGRKI